MDDLSEEEQIARAIAMSMQSVGGEGQVRSLYIHYFVICDSFTWYLWPHLLFML